MSQWKTPCSCRCARPRGHVSTKLQRVLPGERLPPRSSRPTSKPSMNSKTMKGGPPGMKSASITFTTFGWSGIWRSVLYSFLRRSTVETRSRSTSFIAREMSPSVCDDLVRDAERPRLPQTPLNDVFRRELRLRQQVRVVELVAQRARRARRRTRRTFRADADAARLSRGATRSSASAHLRHSDACRVRRCRAAAARGRSLWKRSRVAAALGFTANTAFCSKEVMSWS